MDEAISTIQSLCHSIQKMEFLSPGIFTNAMMSRPELTTLIRDALPGELQLYKITLKLGSSHTAVLNENATNRRHSVKHMEDAIVELGPVRVDGRSTYSARIGAKTAVDTPQVPVQIPILSEEMSLPTKQNVASQYSLLSRRVIDSTDPKEICNAIFSLDDSAPHLKGLQDSKEKAAQLLAEYERLSKDVGSLRSQNLDKASKNDPIYELLTQDINELIAKEQLEVDRLEKEVDRI